MGGSRTIIRRARPDDAEGIRNAHVASIRELCADHYNDHQILAWTRNRRAAQYRSAMTDGGEVMFVALDGESVIGFSSLLRDEVRAVYVRARYARQGIGALLLDAAERAARARARPRLWLNSSLNAVPFYKAHGYRRRGRRWHRLADGTPAARRPTAGRCPTGT